MEKLTYEDCEELKGKGFTQEGKGEFLCNVGLKPFDARCGIKSDVDSSEIIPSQHDCKGYIYHPTLSELIEACGEEFVGLQNCIRVRRHPKGRQGVVIREWIATNGLNRDGELSKKREYRKYDDGSELNIFVGRGKSSKQAVKNLWLKLNDTNNQTPKSIK